MIHTYESVNEGQASIMLGNTQPQCVVLYESITSFIWALKIYSNTVNSYFPINNDKPDAQEMKEEKEMKQCRLHVFFVLFITNNSLTISLNV